MSHIEQPMEQTIPLSKVHFQPTSSSQDILLGGKEDSSAIIGMHTQQPNPATTVANSITSHIDSTKSLPLDNKLDSGAMGVQAQQPILTQPIASDSHARFIADQLAGGHIQQSSGVIEPPTTQVQTTHLPLHSKLDNSAIGGSAAQFKSQQSVVDIIMFEHRAVEDLYQQFESATDGSVKEAKMHLLINQLVQHSEKEGAVLYPLMRAKLPHGDKLVDEAVREHQQVTEELYRIDKMKYHAAPEAYIAACARMMTDLQAHVREEEEVLLPSLEAVTDMAERVQLGMQFQAARVTTRPHPMAPREGMMAAAANMASIPLDAMRDHMRFTQNEKTNAAKEI